MPVETSLGGRGQVLVLAALCAAGALLGLAIGRALGPSQPVTRISAFTGVVRGPGTVRGDFVLGDAHGTIRALRRRGGRATGTVTFVADPVRFTGRVTCLEVDPPRAVVGVRGVMRRPEHRGPEPRSGLFTVTDGVGSADTVFYDLPPGRRAPDCAAGSFTRQVAVSGTLAVRRAPVPGLRE